MTVCQVCVRMPSCLVIIMLADQGQRERLVVVRQDYEGGMQLRDSDEVEEAQKPVAFTLKGSLHSMAEWDGDM